MSNRKFHKNSNRNNNNRSSPIDWALSGDKFKKHYEIQHKLASRGPDQFWSKDAANACQIDIFRAPIQEAAHLQREALNADYTLIGRARKLSCSPTALNRLVGSKSGNDSGSLLRVGRKVLVNCTVHGVTEGFFPQRRGDRGPRMTAVCSKCFWMSRNKPAEFREMVQLEDSLRAIGRGGKVQTQNRDPAPKDETRTNQQIPIVEETLPKGQDLTSLSKLELRALCEEQQLPVSGTKAVLIQRLTKL